MEPIELECCDCGARIGFFDFEKLSRVVRASLRAMIATFGDAGDDDAKGKLPVVCPSCKEKARV